MKKFYLPTLLVLMVVVFSSCKKDSTTGGRVPVPIVTTDTILLSNLETSSDAVTLKWSKLTDTKFVRYMIIRRNYKSPDPNTYSYNDIIDYIDDASTLNYTDHSFSDDPYLEYQVIGMVQDTSAYGYYKYIYSNVRSFERPQFTLFYLNIKDVLPDVPNHRCYVIGADSGKISILDYQSRTIQKEIFTNATLGYCALGNFNGTEELYVPRNDGWLFIYDANTLDLVDQIKSGARCKSVVANNGKLFIVTDTGYYNYAIKVFDRSSKAMIEFTGISEGPEHIVLVPGSNTKLLGLGSYYMFAFEYDANGQYVSWGAINYSSGSSNMRALEALPNGQGLITSTTGSVYSGSLNFVQNLPYGDYQFSSYAFNTPFTSIFSGCCNYKTIAEYAYPGFSEKKTYSCVGYPAAVFVDGNNLISLSGVYEYYPYYNDAGLYYIETLPLAKK
jgi:hypothetical protein